MHSTGPRQTAAKPSGRVARSAAAPVGCTAFKLRQLSRRVSQHFDHIVGASGLKTTQYSLLSHVVRLGPIRPGDLAVQMERKISKCIYSARIVRLTVLQHFNLDGYIGEIISLCKMVGFHKIVESIHFGIHVRLALLQGGNLDY